MPVIYDVKIESILDENTFRITWTDVAGQSQEGFEQSHIEITPEEVDRLWLDRRFQMNTGHKLFRFLDGKARYLQRALNVAARKKEPLLLRLRACPITANWPFELLAYAREFLLPGQMHLVRQVSEVEEKIKVPTSTPPLKLLFVVCSAPDIKSDLNFQKEKETIIKVTRKMPIDLDIEDSSTLEGLHRKLVTRQYDVVHLSGYTDIDTNGQPFFIMEDEAGNHLEVHQEQIWQQALINNPPGLLFLSGIRTGQAPIGKAVLLFSQLLVEKYKIPAVLGWGRSVADKQAIKAEEVIYDELSQGHDILTAVLNARRELIQSFPHSEYAAWPMLRLYCSSVPLTPLVRSD